MQVEAIKQVIKDQRSEMEQKFRVEKIIERENLHYAKKFLKYPNILAILGVRRSGKSIFSYILSKDTGETFAYINFDDERLFGITKDDLNRILQAFYELYGEIKLIFLDEVQNVKGWELFVNRLRRTKKVIITGSNSQLLSGELATHLTGRYMDFTLCPFSFREVLNFKPDIYLTEDVAKIRNQLNEYVKGSGFPEFRKFGSGIVVKIYEDIINKDCIRRYNIRDQETFRELAKYLVSNFSSEITYSKLSKLFDIKDVHTAKNYVSYLKQAFVVITLERFSPKLKQQFIAPKKVYSIDHGFCNFLSFRLSESIGRIFENIICIDLFRRKTKPREDIYYWKNPQQEEVDFVVKEGIKIKQLIQVCYDVQDYSTKEREVRALLKASKELKCKNLLVITADTETEEKIDSRKIKYIPLWKWLLEVR